MHSVLNKFKDSERASDSFIEKIFIKTRDQ